MKTNGVNMYTPTARPAVIIRRAPCGLTRAVPRKRQNALALLAHGVDVGAMRDQQLHDVSQAGAARPDQRRCASVVLGIHLGGQ